MHVPRLRNIFTLQKEGNISLTVSGHAKGQALLQPAELAPVAVDAVDDAVLLPGALVVDDGGLRAAEEALAALARDDSVVDPRRLVPAHLARDHLDLR